MAGNHSNDNSNDNSDIDEFDYLTNNMIINLLTFENRENISTWFISEQLNLYQNGLFLFINFLEYNISPEQTIS